MWNIFENPCLYTNIPSMNEELNLDVCVVVVFYSNFNFLKATVRVERHPKSKSGDKIKISKPCPCPPLALLTIIKKKVLPEPLA